MVAQIGFKNDKGLRRINNEDACFVVPSDDVYIVADGVGGNNAGEIASRTAVSMIAAYVKENPLSSIKDEDELQVYFTDCLEKVNTEIYALAHKYDENKGMATTAVIAYIRDSKAYIVNVGDSRAYLIRGEKISQITEDHTYVNELIKNGIITDEEGVRHPKRHIITRALGGDAIIEPDIFRVEIKKDDVLLLCTDGLHSEISEGKIVSIVSESESMTDACRLLVNAANRSGGRDNITVICLKI